MGTVRAALLSNAQAQPGAPAFSFRTGEDWTTWTWVDTARIALATGRALRSKYDLEMGSAIVLDVPNGPVWLALDLGAQIVGAYTIPIYAGAPDSSAQTALETIRTLADPKVLFTYRPAAFEGFEADGDVELATVEYLLDLVRRSYETDASGLSTTYLPRKHLTSSVACTCVHAQVTSREAECLRRPSGILPNSAPPSKTPSNTGEFRGHRP